MKPVAIIGTGITGLTAAFYLKRKGIPVTLYEAGGRTGGVIQSSRRDGFLAELGPNTILETSPKIAQLVRDAGLEARKLATDPKAEARFIVRYGRPMEMPASPLGFFTTKLFSARAKLAVLREPFVKPRRDGAEESIAEFVARRLNQEFLDQAIDALAAGVYAGDPYRLSVQQAFPRLAELEARYGSLIKGQIFGAHERKRRGEVAKDRAPKFSFDEGLQVLPDTLAAQLGEAVRLNTPVKRLRQTENGWRVSTAAGEAEHAAVVYCGTAYRLAELEIEGGNIEYSTSNIHHPMKGNPSSAHEPLAGESKKSPLESKAASREEGALPPHPDPLPRGEGTVDGQPSHPDVLPAAAGSGVDCAAFAEIRYPPVASVVLGFRREDVAHPCQGFGMLIPKVEGFKILGTIFSSSLFPNRAPAGHLTLSSYVGGERQPELALLPAEKLVELTLADLRTLLGVRGLPVFTQTATYARAIPQYNVGYGRYRELMTNLEARLPGLFLAGHYRDGVSLGDSMVSGCNVAERVEKFLPTS